MTNVITAQDMRKAEAYANTRANDYTKVWLECREAYLQALREERGGSGKLPQAENPTETWGAP